MLILSEFIDEYENDIELQHTIVTMKMKWLHYYGEIPIIYLVACVFYPCCKLDGLSDYLHMYYQCLHYDMINVRTILSEVKNIVIKLYNEFSTKYNLGDLNLLNLLRHKMRV